MPEETGERLCETWGNIRGSGRKHLGNCHLRGFLRHLVTSSQEDLHRFLYRWNNLRMLGNLH